MEREMRVQFLAGSALEVLLIFSNIKEKIRRSRSQHFPDIRDFKIQRRGRQWERKKKAIGLISKTTTSHAYHTFLYIYFPFLHDYDVKMPKFARFMEDVNKQRRNLFLFLSLNMVTWNSPTGGFAYIWQSRWVGIITIKTVRTQIHFLSNVLVAIALLDLIPISLVERKRTTRAVNSMAGEPFPALFSPRNTLALF